MERALRTAMLLKVIITFLCASNGLVEKDLGQAIGLFERSAAFPLPMHVAKTNSLADGLRPRPYSMPWSPPRISRNRQTDGSTFSTHQLIRSRPRAS